MGPVADVITDVVGVETDFVKSIEQDHHGTRISPEAYQALGSGWDLVPWNRLQDSFSYADVSDTYVCGLNAMNKSLKMWNRGGHQRGKGEYSHTFIPGIGTKMGPRANQYLEMLNHSFGTVHSSIGSDFSWRIFNDHSYDTHCAIFMCSYGITAHYALVVGKRNDNEEYIVTDQTNLLWRIPAGELKRLTRVSVPTCDNYALFSVG